MIHENYVCDYETDRFIDNAQENYVINPLFMGVWNFANDKFEIVTEFDRFFHSKCDVNKKVTLWFHYLDFDAKFIIPLLKKDYSIKIQKCGGKIVQILFFKTYESVNRGKKVTKRHIYLELRDTYALLRSKVKNIGRTLKLAKLKIDYAKMDSESGKIYCRRDCEIIVIALKRLTTFIKDNFELDYPIEALPLTLPSIAKRIFHKLTEKMLGLSGFDLLKTLYPFDSTNEKYRKYYFGGRVEVYDFKKHRNVYYNDFNSAYPFEMFRNDFPLPPYSFKKFRGNIVEMMKDPLLFGGVFNVYEDSNVPLFPFRNSAGKVLFPTGLKECFLFRKEIEYCFAHNIKIEPIELAFCTVWKPIFKIFVDKTYYARKALKKLSKGVETYETFLFKILMNALYGKFAENPNKQRYEIFALRDLPKDPIELRKFTSIDAETFIRSDEIILPIKINVFFSMLITAYARLNLYEKMDSSKSVIYCDTDSILSLTNIEDSSELGAMKLEECLNTFIALGCKEYYADYAKKGKFKSEIKFKGLTKNVKCENEFYGLYENPITIRRPSKITESIRRRIPLNSILVYQKQKNHSYDKRIINKDLSTRPISVSDCEFLPAIEKMNKKIIDEIIRSEDLCLSTIWMN